MKIHYLQSNRGTSILINCYPYSMCYTVAMTKLDNYLCYLNDISSNEINVSDDDFYESSFGYIFVESGECFQDWRDCRFPQVELYHNN